MLKTAFLLLLFVASGFSLSAFDVGIPVEIDSSYSFANSVSQSEARQRAWQFSRDAAVMRALPQGLSWMELIASLFAQRDDSFDAGAAGEIFLHTTAAGYFLSESILSEFHIYPKKSNQYRYKMRFQARILPPDSRLQSTQKLDVEASLITVGSTQATTLTATPGQDGYLYVFAFYPQDNFSLIYPDMNIYNQKLNKNSNWSYKLACPLPEGAESGLCTLCFIFSPEPLNGWDKFCAGQNTPNPLIKQGYVSFNLFQSWLSGSDPALRAEKFIQLRIPGQD